MKKIKKKKMIPISYFVNLVCLLFVCFVFLLFLYHKVQRSIPQRTRRLSKIDKLNKISVYILLSFSHDEE